MRKELKSFEIIKKMYIYFVKKSRDLEPKLMICEKEDFDNVENALKALEIIKEIDKTALLHLFAVCIKDKEKIDFLKEVLL